MFGMIITAGLFMGASGVQRSFVRGKFSDSLSHLMLSASALKEKQKLAVLCCGMVLTDCF